MYIHIRVLTSQKKEVVEKISNDRFKILLKEKPVRNMANRRILEIFSNLFKTNKIRIISGANSPSKLLSIDI